MKPTDVYITVGKIGSTYGVKGWLKIQAYTEFGASILDYQPWYLSDSQHDWKQVQVEDGREHGNIVVAKIAGLNTPEEARLLTGKLIAIQRSQLPELNKDEYYWSDLVGLTVINQRNEALGKVAYLIETGSNDVLVIKDADGKEHAIPYLPGRVVSEVNLERQEIRVDWELI